MTDEPPSQDQARPRRSHLAAELRRLDPGVRALTGLRDMTVQLLDALVTGAWVMTDDSDPRPLLDRLPGLAEMFDLTDLMHNDWISEELDRLGRDDLERWAHRLKDTGGFVKFANRLVGQATFDRLTQAAREDGQVIAVAMRRGLRGIMPFAVALEDLAAGLTDEQIEQLRPLSSTNAKFLDLALELDGLIDRSVVRITGQLESALCRADELEAIKVEDIAVFSNELRQVVSGRSRTVLNQISSLLERKIQGARDALAHSADPVSQAANSIIELIDRLLRSAFTDDEVVTWVRTNFPEDTDRKALLFEDNGKIRPTKRGQALCFAFAGNNIDTDDIAVHMLIAVGLEKARRNLQKLKHADGNLADEIDAIEAALRAVEGFIALTAGITWAGASDERLEQLRQRLDPSYLPPVAASVDTVIGELDETA